jgi:hypothetical protein
MKKFLRPLLLSTKMGWIDPKTISHCCPFNKEAKQREERLERGMRGSHYGCVG